MSISLHISHTQRQPINELISFIKSKLQAGFVFEWPDPYDNEDVYFVALTNKTTEIELCVGSLEHRIKLYTAVNIAEMELADERRATEGTSGN